MNSVILAASRGTSVKRFADCARKKWTVRDEDSRHCLILKGTFHVILNADDSISEDYDEVEMALLRRLVPDPSFFMFEFNNVQFGKEILATMVDAKDVAVDDDHGNIIIGEDFVRKLELERQP